MLYNLPMTRLAEVGCFPFKEIFNSATLAMIGRKNVGLRFNGGTFFSDNFRACRGDL